MSGGNDPGQRGCGDDELSVKSFFLGPCAENGDWLRERILELLGSWFETRRRTSSSDGTVIPSSERANPAFLRRQAHLEDMVSVLARRFEKELPKYSPRYMGHMFSELSMPALLGHLTALLHNPNNISKEASTVGLEIEREAVQMLFAMLGARGPGGTGHFTSGGTIANFEALLRARARQRRWISLGAYLHETKGAGPTLFEAAQMGWENFHRCLDAEGFRKFIDWSEPLIHSETFFSRIESAYKEHWVQPVMIVSSGAHYSWAKAADFFGISREALVEAPLDAHGRLDSVRLKELLDGFAANKRPVMIVVTIAGSTELGTVDPIDRVCDELGADGRWKSSVWHHVDAAYGGFFACVGEDTQGFVSSETRARLRAIRRATSVTIDPHKLGYVPYASGVFLCMDSRDYAHHRVDAPYIDFDDGTDPGLQTIEGSRAATGAAATWLTGQAIGFNAEGYGRILRRTAEARVRLERHMTDAFGAGIFVPPGLDLNIFCFALKPEARLSRMNKATLNLYAKSGTRGLEGFSLSKTSIGFSESRRGLRELLAISGVEVDEDHLVLIRSCLMNPFSTSRHANTDFLRSFARAAWTVASADFIGS